MWSQKQARLVVREPPCFNENQEGGLLGFYFTKICQALDENVKLTTNLYYARA